MFRFRKYRVYVAFAAATLFLLYRMSQQPEWEGLSADVDYPYTATRPAPKLGPKPDLKLESISTEQLKKPDSLGHDDYDLLVAGPPTPVIVKGEEDLSLKKAASADKTELLKVPLDSGYEKEVNKVADSSDSDAPGFTIPDRKTPHSEWQNHGEAERPSDKKVISPEKEKEKEKAIKTTKEVPHWVKPTEFFPIASESIIPLPTGKPKTIPKVQHEFKAESPEAREKRETRLAQVKAEMQRAWTGYRTYAWKHDELSPVSKRFRDPFCGWAASLVDALDTLWIMGMTEEFDEAVQAVAEIDFTTTPRPNIPVFETTIRYLGGLLGAYDVSGGAAGGYQVLVDKAVELAEILMGVFDTPNRMPILYYQWKPSANEIAKQAANGANVAELGTLAMEFTRLAQVTGDNRYYDAVARITDAFEELQNRAGGTAIHGIFPEQIDSTGCNRTAERHARDKFEKAKPKSSEKAKPKSSKKASQEATKKISEKKTHSLPDLEDDPSINTLSRRRLADQEELELPLVSPIVEEPSELTFPEVLSPPDLYQQMMSDKATAGPFSIPNLSPGICYPQGLTPVFNRIQTYSMGGAQDSTYEYFPKQFLLLGGLEPKYRDMHLKVAAAVKEWLLYRPMVPEDRDILFSAKVSTRGHPDKDASLDFEVTHLTCFLGGMFGMAGKLFDEPADVEIGKRLTDGCVWAYESMPSGIMPEGATVVPCSEVNNCHWNQTLWYQYLDPAWDMRQLQIDDYEARKAAKIAHANSQKSSQQSSQPLRSEPLRSEEDVGEIEKKLKKTEAEELRRQAEDSSLSSAGKKYDSKKTSPELDDLATSKVRKDNDEKAHMKRSMDVGYEGGSLETRTNDNLPSIDEEKRLNLLESLAPNTQNGGQDTTINIRKPSRSSQTILLDDTENQEKLPDPLRPPTHEEYVKGRLKNERIPAGYVRINSQKYILRPEAIESVWYMYRITGDTTWQDKGWNMWQAIIAATQTESGHSAVADVLSSQPTKTNEMESFWFAETLKYFYLLYSTPDVISLDEWVLNTEAHPFKRPT
ncbi:glycosyl hydrolase family 47-domain-containing protein [Xylariales sp. PMI_506]|nr:glycosyl hydrolase family 47-domain-containing protein [Xylariales sp. PMI_506]